MDEDEIEDFKEYVDLLCNSGDENFRIYALRVEGPNEEYRELEAMNILPPWQGNLILNYFILFLIKF